MVVIRRKTLLLEVGIAWLFFDKCEDRIMATKHLRASLFSGKKIKKNAQASTVVFFQELMKKS